MIIIAALVVLFLLFFAVRKHVGTMLLAVIAGLSVNEMFGQDLAWFLHDFLGDAPIELLQTCVFLVLVLGLPLVIYLQAGRGGLFGLLRILEAALIASLITIIISTSLNYFLIFDDLSLNIIEGLNHFKGPILAAGIAFAYFDIIFYRE